MSAKTHLDRSTSRLTRHAVLAACIIIALAVLAIGCGSQEEVPDTILTIDQALAAEEGQAVRVQGMLVATESHVVLASVLLESYPPQAGGSTLVVEDLDLQALVGLSSTADQPELAQVTWSDFPVVLQGTMDEGILKVTEIPPVVEVSTADVRVRFSPSSEPLKLDDMVWWVFDVTNLTAAPVDLTFTSGQMGEVVLTQTGAETYRWSDGKSFIQAVTVNTLQPGVPRAIVLNDRLTVAPGVYDLTAKVTASIGPEGSATPLPEIVTTLTVR